MEPVIKDQIIEARGFLLAIEKVSLIGHHLKKTVYRFLAL